MSADAMRVFNGQLELAGYGLVALAIMLVFAVLGMLAWSKLSQ